LVRKVVALGRKTSLPDDLGHVAEADSSVRSRLDPGTRTPRDVRRVGLVAEIVRSRADAPRRPPIGIVRASAEARSQRRYVEATVLREAVEA
jgi:hypothetical protein